MCHLFAGFSLRIESETVKAATTRRVLTAQFVFCCVRACFPQLHVSARRLIHAPGGEKKVRKHLQNPRRPEVGGASVRVDF